MGDRVQERRRIPTRPKKISETEVGKRRMPRFQAKGPSTKAKQGGREGIWREQNQNRILRTSKIQRA
ncbi:hypothetical protein BCR33DRAFT_719720, partial [Rhizoclosmatium globosum]